MKRNEGYTLPFVLVVMIVLCLVASGLLAGALRNLQSQQAVIERMQDQYEAQGAIEIVVAQLERLESVNGANATDALKSKITDICNSVYGDGEPTDPNPGYVAEEKVDGVTAEPSDFEYSFGLTSKYGSAGGIQIDCTIQLSGKICKDGESLNGIQTYKIANPKIKYESYTITNLPEGGGA